MKNILGLLVLTMIASACTGGKNGENSYAKSYSGNIYNLMRKFYSEDRGNLSKTCDYDLKEIKLEMTKALESKKNEIQKLRNADANTLSDDKYKLISVGKIQIFDNRSRNIGKDLWEKVDEGDWYSLIGRYKKIKNTPVDMEWVRLDFDVRYILGEEEDRITYNANLSLDYDDQDDLAELVNLASNCYENSECYEIDAPYSLKNWMKTKAYFYSDFLIVQNSKDKEFRENIKKYFNYVSDNYYWTYMVRNGNHQVDSSTNTITVRLNMSIFSPNERIIADYIEEIWSQHGLTVKILTEKHPSYSYFKFKLENNRTRAEVQYGTQEILFGPYSRFTTMAHEFGHVLGLRDEYYQIWEEHRCGYSSYSNNGNIMSFGATGIVLEKQIKDLMETYF